MRTYNDTVIVGLIVSRSETFPVLHTHTHTFISRGYVHTVNELSRFTSRGMKTYYSRDVFRLGRIDALVLVGPHQPLHSFD